MREDLHLAGYLPAGTSSKATRLGLGRRLRAADVEAKRPATARDRCFPWGQSRKTITRGSAAATCGRVGTLLPGMTMSNPVPARSRFQESPLPGPGRLTFSHAPDAHFGHQILPDDGIPRKIINPLFSTPRIPTLPLDKVPEKGLPGAGGKLLQRRRNWWRLAPGEINTRTAMSAFALDRVSGRA